MREIKFRAWDKWEKRMREPEDEMVMRSMTGTIGFEWCSEGGGGVEHNEHLIPLQYTGLKDAKGVEIYEGDILQDIVGYYTADSKLEKYKVEWNDETTGWNPFASYDSDCGIYTKEDKIEVIGNIYQNPELLK